MLHRQRAVAARREAGQLDAAADRLETTATRMNRARDPDVRLRARGLRDRALELRSEADRLRRDARRFARGEGDPTEVVPTPEEIERAIDLAERGLGEKMPLPPKGNRPPEGVDPAGWRISADFAPRSPETLARMARDLMRSRSGNRVVFRVQGGGGRPIIQVENGNLVFSDAGRSGEYIHFNFGSEERALEYLRRNRPGGEIIAFEVSEEWVRSLRSAAIPQRGTGEIRNIPRLVDVTAAPDQLEVPTDLIDEMAEFVIPGTARSWSP